MVIAAAGPASNLVLAVMAAILLRVVAPAEAGAERVAESVATGLYFAVRINVLLAVFNMLPVPPLDGGNVLSGLLTGPMADTFDRLRPYGFLILYGLMLTGVLSTIILPTALLFESWLL